jgi:hypothetical protein
MTTTVKPETTTHTHIATWAILGLPVQPAYHAKVGEIIFQLGLNTNLDALNDISAAIRTEWLTAHGERKEALHVAKGVINQIRRNPAYGSTTGW